MKNYLVLANVALFVTTIAFFACDKSKQTSTITPDPNAKGCGDFIVNKIVDSDKIVSIWIDHQKIAFSTDLQVFPEAEKAEFARIELEQNCDIETVWEGVCNDVVQFPNCPSVHWKLLSGSLSFKVSKLPATFECIETYYATVILENAVFQKENSTETLVFGSVAFNNVQVGWCAG